MGRGKDPGQGGQHHSIGRLKVGAVYLPAQHRDLMAKDQEFDVLGFAIAGELGQHDTLPTGQGRPHSPVDGCVERPDSMPYVAAEPTSPCV